MSATAEHVDSMQEAIAARDESRLSLIAYWLERYRGADFAKDMESKFKQMIVNLQTPDALEVAKAWFYEKPIPPDNRFSKVAPHIREWAIIASGKR